MAQMMMSEGSSFPPDTMPVEVVLSIEVKLVLP